MTGKSKEPYVPAGSGKLPTRGSSNENGEESFAELMNVWFRAGQDELTKTRTGLSLQIKTVVSNISDKSMK